MLESPRIYVERRFAGFVSTIESHLSEEVARGDSSVWGTEDFPARPAAMKLPKTESGMVSAEPVEGL